MPSAAMNANIPGLIFEFISSSFRELMKVFIVRGIRAVISKSGRNVG